MSATAWASWLDRLESARSQEQVLSSKIRTGNSGGIGTSVFALQQSVSRLKRDFDQLQRSSSSSVTAQEMKRRERLLNQLARDQSWGDGCTAEAAGHAKPDNEGSGPAAGIDRSGCVEFAQLQSHRQGRDGAACATAERDRRRRDSRDGRT
uniref:Uncharacterized protein n=1 Tax=Hyaloperonospora arabidopsidis (strain Emoy2) TaxID=559515 RepID=M4BFS1_HYAAE